MDEPTLPVLGLLADVILPDEERTVDPRSLDASTVDALRAAVPERLLALPVDSPVQLPSYVTARWGTECEVAGMSPEGIRLRGLRRVRVRQVYGTQPPFHAAVEAGDEESAVEVLEGAHALMAALEVAVRERADAVAKPFGGLLPLLRRMARVLLDDGRLRAQLGAPLGETLRAAGQALVSGVKVEDARCRLAAVMEKLRDAPDVPPAVQRELVGTVVEIQKKLGIYEPLSDAETTGDLASLQRRLERAGLPAAARRVAKRSLRLLRDMPTNHHDYSSHVNHLELLAELPWHSEPLGEVDMARTRERLNAHHFGLHKPKERILEYLAVRALGGKARGVVLCLAGPPGVGKTSLARRIAEGLDRKFVRISLGGAHDECEIRGHRQSFLAAAPGRIIRGIAQVRSRAPVMLLDEIDKIGKDKWRSPAAALLEVLDPEQNREFEDNYLAVPYDLSEVFFICTANDIEEVMPTLRDRLEVVDLEGYTVAEKIEIAQRHLLAELAEEHGFAAPLAPTPDVLPLAIEGYTREAGVRELGRLLAGVYRVRAVERLSGRTADGPVEWAEFERIHGPRRHHRQVAAATLPVGVATGLSIGAAGGAVLFVEAVRMSGTGQLRLTGRLGEVMREAAQAALVRLRADAASLGLQDRVFRRSDFHVHVPEGATPKDGPSAGTALYLALLSAACGAPVRADRAFSGEITLRGAVLPVGGVRAKVLAAERAGVRLVILPADNRADVPPDLQVEVQYVERVEELPGLAFERPPGPAPRGVPVVPAAGAAG